MNLRTSLEQKFAEPITCYEHCTQPSSFRVISDRPIVACYYCMAGYVSRIMTYGTEVDLLRFKTFITNTIGGMGTVEDQDIRVATRHAWESPDLAGEVRVAYWTQNYRRTKVDNPNRDAVFVCGKCDTFFIQLVRARSALCADCRIETP